MKLISARASFAPSRHQHGEAGAGDLRAALEIEDSERRAEIPVRLRLEVEPSRLTDPPHLGVVVGTAADGNGRMWNIGNGQQ